MPARTPEELDVLFANAINAGDIEAVMLTLDVKKLAETAGIALTTSKWVLEGTGPDGKPLRTEGQSAEVARRQPDGTWLFVSDNPFGLQLAEGAAAPTHGHAPHLPLSFTSSYGADHG